VTQTAQVATDFKQTLMAMLPTNRDISSTMLMAPAVHLSGPSVFNRRRYDSFISAPLRTHSNLGEEKL
jgi:hypothetical protein